MGDTPSKASILWREPTKESDENFRLLSRVKLLQNFKFKRLEENKLYLEFRILNLNLKI